MDVTRWHFAGVLRRYFPDVRGADRLFTLARGKSVPRRLTGTQTVMRIGNGLRITADVSEDGTFADIFFAQYRPPSLAPILEAALNPGDVFLDVGANVGIYTLWASKIVGPSGSVHAFEPAPRTRAWLDGVVSENAAENVRIIASAVSDRSGCLLLRTFTEASGRSTAAPVNATGLDELDTLEVPVTTLDEYALANHCSPALVKIDVEGLEPLVLQGMSWILAEAKPVVVFESPDLATGQGTRESVATLRSHGYRVFSLMPAGLVRFGTGKDSHNLLALHPARHSLIEQQLRRRRFHRSQNC